MGSTSMRRRFTLPLTGLLAAAALALPAPPAVAHDHGRAGDRLLSARTAQEDPRFRVLVFSRTTAFRHTEAINAGKAAIAELAAQENFEAEFTEDATRFTEENLRTYDAVVFLNTDGNGVLRGEQRIAFERYIQSGGGLAGIHSSSNADTDWAWYGDMLAGAWFNNHPSGALQFQTATVRIEDPNHPATAGLPTEWVREDEWYNFKAEPRGKVHVLATLDESTYEEQDGTPEADDHPIAWCSNFDGGRHFYTAMGHHGAYYAEPLFREHILGGIEWAAGAAQADCGANREAIPSDSSFDKVTLDDNTENPMELAVAPDGRVFYVELAGRVKLYDPENQSVRAIGTIPVHRGNENGLLGIALDPDFETNNWVYLFYSAPTPEEQHVSRFTFTDGQLDMGSEVLLLKFPHQRIICCHSAGSMTFGPDGNLYISTGDDTQHATSQGFNPIDDRLHDEVVSDNPDAKHAFDSRRSSGNTNDLRGKILRIHPRPDAAGEPGPGRTYDIPGGNLFDPLTSDPTKTRPEIYTMGHRNPFRIQVDQETGWVYNGEVGPDASNDNANRGPRGYDELNQIRQAGNYGWPFCIADNKAYRDYDFATGVSGPSFDCQNGPANDSAWNTGLSQVPPAQSALLWWPYTPGTPYPADYPFDEPPLAIPPGPGRTAIAGPTYHFDASNPSQTKLSAYYDDKVFFADWSRDWIATLTLDGEGRPASIEEFMPATDFRHPHDMEMGPDGALYILEWGRDFNYAGANINPDSGLYRIEYAKGNRTPRTRASADKTSGPAPLTVAFSSEGTFDPDGDELTYEWDFGDGETSAEPNPTHVFDEPGTFTVRLAVTDATGKTGTSTITINAGNTAPTVSLDAPPDGGFVDFGDEVAYDISVADPEDGQIDCGRVTMQPGLFHDEGGNAHVHPGAQQPGCEGTVDVESESGHGASAKLRTVLTASYTDTGGQPGSSPLTGGVTHRLNPKLIQAEHYDGETGTQLNSNLPEAGGGRRVGFNDAGEWIYFDPVSFKNIDGVTVRYTSGDEGGDVEFRLDGVEGPLVGTVRLPNTGGWDNYAEVTAPIDAPDDAPHRLYLVYKALPGNAGNDLFDLDELTFRGKGVAVNAAPTVSAQADKTAGAAPLTVAFTSEASDPEGTALTYAWDFDSDGTVDATTANASHTYDEPGSYTAKVTATDEGGRSASAEIDIIVSPSGGCFPDDEFSGTAIDRSLWPEIVRDDPSLYSVGEGALALTAAPGDIYGGGTGLPNLILRPLPTGGAWTATAVMNWRPTVNYQNAGLLVYDDDANYIKADLVFAGDRKFEVAKELNNSPSLQAGPNLPASFPDTFHLRLVYDGAVLRPQYSADGQQWTNLGNPLNLTGLDNPRIGLYATRGGATEAPVARFDRFELSVPNESSPVSEPSDEFDGEDINVCRWSEIVRHRPGGYTVADGHLTLPAAHGDFFGNAPNDNPNMILQPAPEGPWQATVKQRFSPDENYEQAGILVYGDDANYAKADLVSAGGSRTFEFLREVDDSATGFGGSVPAPSGFPEEHYLRVVSDGTVLRAFFSADGESWTPFGEPAPLAAIPNPKVGIYANDGNQTVTSRADAVFDWFHLGSSDTEAPQTSHALDPGAPDGDGGWYVSPVEVSLEASDGDGSGVARTEYRIGSGEWRTYDAPFTVGEDGEHTVQYRSIDEEGNEEEIRSATFKIDRTAPVVACSATPQELWPPNHRMKPVTAAVTVTDATSGPGGFALGAATSSEADAGLDPDDVPGDLAGWEAGAADASGEVRAERSTAGNGRTYSLRYEGRDVAGNTAECTATVRVPKSRGGSG